MLVVDASVVVKWLLPEAHSGAATTLRQHAWAAPDLLAAEVGNVLWRKHRRGEISAEEAAFAALALERSGIDLRPCAPRLRDAVRVATELDHPVYDCFYLVLACELGAQLVTADQRLLARLAASGRPALAALARPLA
jgi:predicted nucleic acid-binding protein